MTVIILRREWALAVIVVLLSSTETVIAQTINDITNVDDATSQYVDPVGRSTVVETGAFGEEVSATDAAGLQTDTTRNDNGNALSTSMPSGAITDRTFDTRGNTTTFTDRTLGGTTAISYDAQYSRVTRVADALMGQTIVEYDTAGNATRLVTPEGRAFNSTYRTDGLLESLTDTLGTVALLNYNSDLLPTDLVVGVGIDARSAQRSYTAEGYLDIDTDAVGRVLDLDYDTLGRVTQVTLPDSRVIAFGYDAGGNVTAITPPGRGAYSYTYDNVGQLSTETYPAVPNGGSNQVGYSYNPARQLTRVTRADGGVVDFAYDAAGRTQTITQENGAYTYNYDATTGQLIGLESPDGVTQNFSYNNERLTQVSWTGAVAGSVGYAYDVKGRIATLDINGQDFTYAYNLDDDIVQAGLQSLSYDANSGLLIATSLDTISETFSYNQFAELSRHTVVSGATTLYDVQYTRDRLGRITQAIENVDGSTITIDYSYDLAGRLETVREDGVLLATFSYDSNDNRTDNGGTYDAQDRVIALTGITYTHSAQGERTQKTEGVNVTAYQYDVQGTLIGATLPDAMQITYLRDGQSRRIAKQLNGTTTESWLYHDALQPAARLDAANTVTQRYIYADRSTVPAYIDVGATQYKVISDHLGSVRLVVDAGDGTIVQRIDYDPWGSITADSNPDFQPFAYAGGLHDNDTGLTHFGLREYDSLTAHWTSKDPISFDGSINNLYAYVGAEPVNNIDPTGLESTATPTRGTGVGKVRGVKGRNAWVTRRPEVTRGDGPRSGLRARDAAIAGVCPIFGGDKEKRELLSEEVIHVVQNGSFARLATKTGAASVTFR